MTRLLAVPSGIDLLVPLERFWPECSALDPHAPGSGSAVPPSSAGGIAEEVRQRNRCVGDIKIKIASPKPVRRHVQSYAAAAGPVTCWRQESCHFDCGVSSSDGRILGAAPGAL